MNVENILYSIYKSGRWLTQGSVYTKHVNAVINVLYVNAWQSSMFCPIFFKLGSEGRSVSLPMNFVIPPPHLPNATWANWKVILYVNIPCWHCKQSIWKIQRICQSVRDAHREIIMSKITLCFLNSRPHLHGFVWPIMATQNINIAGSKR